MNIIAGPTEIAKLQLPIGLADLQFGFQPGCRLHPFEEGTADQRQPISFLKQRLLCPGTARDKDE
jgi:hypothetical protein